MAKIPIALQLYSVREDCARDLPGTLQAVAAMGYAGVEFAGYHGRDAAELRRMLDDLGLKVAGTHLHVDALVGDELERTIEFNRALGNTFLICAGLPKERCTSRAAYREAAGLFNQAAERAAAADMRVGFHNHMREFEPLDGELPWDTFFGAAKPQVVMQVDTGNALAGGQEPVELLERYPGRATTVHLKEHAGDGRAVVIGEGDVRWNDVFRLCETTGGTQWYIVEQESYAHPPLECVRMCLDNLRKMGK
ncbi:MAG TPA: sugar phosphate isomerase/epimerase [Armatimonadota bacterium]|nr:sugar phosphate isomerase/epimerase [Armatimonadota bacterium]